MRRLVPLSVALAVVLLAAPGAQAQQKGRGKGGFGRGGGMGFGLTPVALLSQKSVQEELKLSEDQLGKVKELAAKQRGGGKGFKDLSKEERQQRIEERAKASDKAIAAILKPEQVTRLKQISLQVRGARAFSDPQVASALKLTDDQKEKIKTIQEDARKDMRELFQGGGGEGAREKIAAARKATNEKAMNVLTPDQKATWKELTGAPFTGEITPPRPRGRRPTADARLGRGRGPAAVFGSRKGTRSRQERTQD